jgi:hypothetical protein
MFGHIPRPSSDNYDVVALPGDCFKLVCKTDMCLANEFKRHDATTSTPSYILVNLLDQDNPHLSFNCDDETHQTYPLELAHSSIHEAVMRRDDALLLHRAVLFTLNSKKRKPDEEEEPKGIFETVAPVKEAKFDIIKKLLQALHAKGYVKDVSGKLYHAVRDVPFAFMPAKDDLKRLEERYDN